MGTNIDAVDYLMKRVEAVKAIDDGTMTDAITVNSSLAVKFKAV